MAEQHSNVPKFGNWENEDNIPYTDYFEKARKGKKGGKMINPNEPEENPKIIRDKPSPAHRSQARAEPEEPIKTRAVRPTHNRPVSKEDSVLSNTTSVLSDENTNRRTPGGSGPQRGGQGTGAGRGVRLNAGSEQSFERSPLHPHYQAKVSGKTNGSPITEGKNSYDSSHGTQGRSRMKPARGDDSSDRGVTVPRFGDWDDSNSSSANNYTDIFIQIQKERVDGPPIGPGPESRPNYRIPRNSKANDKKCFCLPWFK